MTLTDVQMRDHEQTSPPARSIESVVFRHAPLRSDKLSTRLIKILPRQSDGYVRCELWHATLPRDCLRARNRWVPDPNEEQKIKDADLREAEDDLGILTHPFTGEQMPLPAFSCLSYTWGDPTAGYGILVEDKAFRVRGNLCDFLFTAQDLWNDLFFWIDALCIDQGNVLERNHQVQQMGVIYSQAASVIIWLGRDLRIEQTLHEMRSTKRAKIDLGLDTTFDTSESSSSTFRAATVLASTETFTNVVNDQTTPGFTFEDFNTDSTPDVFSDSTGKVEKVLECITGHVYWTRAWVTQEVLLARQAILMAGKTTFDLRSLVHTFRAAVPYVRESAFEKIVDILLQPHYARSRSLTTSSIVRLLHRFRGKDCSIRRDRIYSLLALCQEGERLEVDYDVSERRLVEQVLRLREESSCFCSLAIVLHALAPWDCAKGACEDNPIFAEIHMYAFRLGSAACPSCGNWVPFSWTRKKGSVFCVGSACPDTQSHIFWELPSAPQDDSVLDATAQPDSLYVQRQQNNRSQLLCHQGEGIQINTTQWDRVYVLSFRFATLIELLSEDFASTELGLNACPNLWPTAEKRPLARMGRLCLIDSSEGETL